MTITAKMCFTLVLLLGVALAPAALGQDVVTVGSQTTPSDAGPLALPVSIRDVSSTRLGGDATRIQAIAIKVDLSPASAVAAASFTRAGVAAGLTPLFERQVSATTGDTLSVSYIVSFEETSQPLPLVLNAAAPGSLVATLNLTLVPQVRAGTELVVAFDRNRTMLANETGAITESAFNRALALIDGEVTVEGHDTETTLTTSPNPSFIGDPVLMTAEVTSATSGSISGTVAFRKGSELLGRSPLSGGQASLTHSALSTGTHVITATYEADTAYRISTSNAVSHIVQVPPFGPPRNVTASATSSTTVEVRWTQVAAYSYDIFRRSSSNGSFTFRGTANQFQTTFVDVVAANTTYLYVVRAGRQGSTESAQSAVDFATSIIFTNDPLTVGTTVRLQHLTQLRTAVNAFRTTAGLPVAVLTDPSPTTQTRPKAVHVTELRTAINEARVALGFSEVSFTGVVAPGMAMSTSHFQEIRNAVK